MSNLRRIPYTKPVPAGAQIVTKKGERFARFKDRRGKTVEAPLTEDGTRVRLLSRKWYGEYKDADGVERCVPLSTDRTAAEQMLAERVRKAELKKVNITDPFEAHRHRPLAEHLDDFERELRTKVRRGKKRPPTPKQVSLKVGRIRRVLDGCGFLLPGDLSLERVQEFLAGLADADATPLLPDPGEDGFTLADVARLLSIKPVSINPLVRRHRLEATGNGKARRFPRRTVEALLARQGQGTAASTVGYYAREVKAFARWLARRKRIPEDPLAELPGATLTSDHRHDRRPLSEDELRRVLAVARDSAEVFRGLSGGDRLHLYLTAMTTGFRAGELASLELKAFDLAGDPATVTLAGDLAKSGNVALRALPALAELVNKPTMEAWVPSIKFGAALEAMRYEADWMARNGVPMDRAALRERFGRVWDSIDNRFGQMVYDNLFWNRAFKDAAMASVRAVGWNVGTWREVGGAARDLPSSLKGLRTGEGISDRLAYTVALTFGSALLGSVTQYALTGKGPQDWRDLFYPRTGRKRPDGTDDRLSFPTYMDHDVLPLFNRADEGPFTVAGNAYRAAMGKMSPAITQANEVLSNQDYYGAAIRNPNDPMTLQTRDVMLHLLKALEPYSVESYRKAAQEKAPVGQRVASFAGITPAPAYVTRPWEQQRQMEKGRRYLPSPLEKRQKELIRK